MTHGVSRDVRTGAPTLSLVAVADTPMTATDVAKWTKAKQNKWKNKTEEKIAKAQKAKERLSRL